MAGRSQQDSFMDDSEDCCPLCVEEFDLSDRQFRPCPCGYQVCQFCYNNIKNNMNGLCPACRRAYDDANIVFVPFTAEQEKADKAAQARKKKAAQQKEAERKQVETQSRKHLAGLRVLQKNLVYVVGMNIPGSEDHVLETLRGPNHFGQYGPIIKILVSKTKEGQPLGIYVTFVNKEDAATCISALDTVLHEGRVLRAQYGTTKYCSAFLRNETCNNRSCMFLHETGDDNDSFSRQDLSSFNALSTQRSSGKADALRPPKQPPVQQSVQSAAPQAQQASSSKPDAISRSDSSDSSALPTSANWAKNPHVEQRKKSGQATNRSTPSPRAAQAKVVSRPQSRAAQHGASSKEPPVPTPKEAGAEDKAVPPARNPKPANTPAIQRLEDAVKHVMNFDFRWSLDRDMFDADTLHFIDNFPGIIDPNGGAIRLARKLKVEREQAAQAAEQKDHGGADDDDLLGGSLQLGGEPDATDDLGGALGNMGLNRRAYGSQFDSPQSFANDFTGRSLTPQQQRNVSLLKSDSADTPLEQFQRPAGNSQHQSQLSNPFQSQNQQLSNLSRHGRQSSRYTFASDPINSLAAIKPTASTQIMQQGQGKGFGTQPPTQSSIYTNTYSNIQGPPPGLKSTGTPPISGGGMFGQGHGFTSGLGGNFGNLGTKGNNEDMMRDMLRSRGGPGSAGASDMGKLDLSDPGILQARMHHAGASQSYGAAGQDRSAEYPTAAVVSDGQVEDKSDQSVVSRKATPAVPPGILLAEFPPLSASQSAVSEAPPAVPPNATAAEKPSKKILPAVPKRPDQQAPPPVDDASSVQKELGAEITGETSPSKPRPAPGKSIAAPKSSIKREKENTAPSKAAKETTTTKKTADVSGKRQKLSKLDMTVTQEPAQKKTQTTKSGETLSEVADLKNQSKAASNSPAAPSTPTTGISQPSPSAAIRQPRTLRLVQTPDVTTPQMQSMNNISIMDSAAGSRTQSGDRSSARPSTPAHETASDAISTASNSVSRDVSPVRKPRPTEEPKGKGKAKKEEQLRSRARENREAKVATKESKATGEEVVQAPIIGRKKKTKKPKEPKEPREPKAPTPGVMDEFATHFLATAEPIATEMTEDDKTTAATEPAMSTADVDEDEEPATIPYILTLPDMKSIIEYLRETGDVESEILDRFLNPPDFNAPTDPRLLDPPGFEFQIDLSEEQIATLEGNRPVIIKVTEHQAAVVCPNHAVLRHLTYEEAASYLRSWDNISRDDPAFLSSAVLPTVYSMDAAWKRCMKTPLSSTGYAMTPQLGHGNIAEQLSLSTLGGVYESGLQSSADAYNRRGFDPTALAAQMENMSLEDADQALKQSEEMMTKARKAAEAEERKLMAVVRRNRKAFKE